MNQRYQQAFINDELTKKNKINYCEYKLLA